MSAERDRGRVLDWLDDRLNPILVREVRQSLRGRYFRYTFWLTLVAATLIGLAVISQAPTANTPDETGLAFFVAIYACLVAAVHFFVPFSGFTSMGAEWEENTYDLLAISNLRPRQIVLGKLLAALVMALLFFSAFGPFLVFAYVMRGIDLTATLVVLGCVNLYCVALTMFSIALSSLSRLRFARLALMAALAVALVYASFASGLLGVQLVSQPWVLQEPESRTVLAVFATVTLLFTGLFFVLGTARLAHPEENRSTGLRVLIALFPLAGLAWMGYVHRTFSRDPEVVWVFTAFIHLFVLVAVIQQVTEPERLGRRARLQVPRNRVLALLAAPFLPGGGRGMLLFLSLVALTVAGAVATLVFDGTTGPIGGLGTATLEESSLLFVAAVALYTLIYVALPTGLLLRLDADRWRVIARLSIPFTIAVAFALPSLVGLFLQREELLGFEHGGNPFWVMSRLGRGDVDSVAATLAVLVGLAAVGLALHVPRMLRGLAEVARESDARRARVAAARAARPPAEVPGAEPDAEARA